MKPEFITFTGVDNWTDVRAMQQLSALYPIEWGVLFSPKRQGVDPRYPRRDSVIAIMGVGGLRLSAHICGGYSDCVMAGGSLMLNLEAFERCQVNHPNPAPYLIATLGASRGIAQCRDAFPDGRDSQWVDWLFDRSGGRGEAPTAWPNHPDGKRLVGYAGGISPDNIRGVMLVLEQMTGPYWIDMESGVRTGDRLDLLKCKAVCEAVYGIRRP